MGWTTVKSALPPGRYFLQGDEACAEGAIAAGCNFYAGYPITPAGEILLRMCHRFAELREQGFAWVVLHQRALMELRGPAEVNTWRTLLAPALGEGMPMSEDTRIYALEPQSSISPPGGGA